MKPLTTQHGRPTRNSGLLWWDSASTLARSMTHDCTSVTQISLAYTKFPSLHQATGRKIVKQPWTWILAWLVLQTLGMTSYLERIVHHVLWATTRRSLSLSGQVDGILTLSTPVRRTWAMLAVHAISTWLRQEWLRLRHQCFVKKQYANDTMRF